MIIEVPVETVKSSPFNSRIRYPSSQIQKLKASLETNGLVVPIKVRVSSKSQLKYELVCGHRRLIAAKELGWKTIRAEVVDATDEQVVLDSLVENAEREDLCDYEKAQVFERMNKEFGMTFEKIGKHLGISRQQVSNYVGMLRLFDADLLQSDPSLYDVLYALSEHHSRVLSHVIDPATRADLARMTVERTLSVRELTNIISHLRSWFRKEDVDFESHGEASEFHLRYGVASADHTVQKTIDDELAKITRFIVTEFQLPRRTNFESFRKSRLFDEGYSLYSPFPPFGRLEKDEALSKERQWFFEIAMKLEAKVQDLRLELLGSAVLATLTVSYSGVLEGRELDMRAGGTVVLKKCEEGWRILHEHWSPLSVEDFRSFMVLKQRR